LLFQQIRRFALQQAIRITDYTGKIGLQVLAVSMAAGDDVSIIGHLCSNKATASMALE